MNCQILFSLLFALMYGQNLGAQTFEWTKKIDVDTSWLKINAIKTDSNNNVYTVGYYNGVIDLDPSVEEYLVESVDGSVDSFIQKLDSNGNFIWGASFGGASGDVAYDISIDHESNILITGHFSGVADFFPGPDTELLVAEEDYDAYLLKMSEDGDFIWVKQFGGSYNQTGQTLCIDNDNNIILMGSHRGTTDFDPGPEVYNVVGEGLPGHFFYATFIVKINEAGEFLWVNSYNGLGQGGYSSVNALLGHNKTDLDNNIYLTGRFLQTYDFDLSDEDHELSAIGGSDIFILKIDQNGNFIWAKSIGSISHDGGTSIHVLDDGTCLATGYYEGDFDINPGDDVEIVYNKGSSDGYILALDEDGNYIWHYSYGGLGHELEQRIYQVGEYIYSTFVFEEKLNFKIGEGILTDTALGSYDLYLLKLDLLGDVKGVKRIGNWRDNRNHASTFADDMNLFVSGHFFDTLLVGSDSLYSYGEYESGFLVKMSNCDWLKDDTLFITECNSFWWEKTGQTYSESGTYLHLSSNIDGACDSIFPLNLELKGNETYFLDTSSCDFYELPSGDNVLYESGFYQDTLISESGCDSILFITLIINGTEPEITRIENDLVVNIEEAFYQWGICTPDFEPLTDENDQIFSFSENGYYSVIVNQNGCSDTSACFEVYDLGNNLNSDKFSWSITPNPASYQISVSLEKPFDNIEVVIINSFGQKVIQTQRYDQNEIILRVDMLSPGTYWVVVRSDEDQLGIGKFIKL